MTVTEYFQKAKEDGYDWADAAIRNRQYYLVCSPEIDHVDSLSEALNIGFSWNHSPEGTEYWCSIYINQSLVNKPDSPGLTAEMFEQRGWKFRHKFQKTISFEKGNTCLDAGRGAFLDVTGDRIKIITTDEDYDQNGPNCSVKFLGICKTIEEFDMICRMIDLKV